MFSDRFRKRKDEQHMLQRTFSQALINHDLNRLCSIQRTISGNVTAGELEQQEGDKEISRNGPSICEQPFEGRDRPQQLKKTGHVQEIRFNWLICRYRTLQYIIKANSYESRW